MAAALLTMAETAAEVGLSYDRFRKVWRAWVRRLGFPAPVTGGDEERACYGWARVAVELWKTARTGRTVAQPPRGGARSAPQAAPEAASQSANPAAVRAREALRRVQEGYA